MLCENCSRKDGTIHIVKVIEGNKIEKWLCNECANKSSDLKIQESKENYKEESNNKNLIIALMDEITDELICINCNTRYIDFKKTGLLGCSECYETFSSIISKIFSCIQGDIGYVGKIPKKENEVIINNKRIMKLKEDLKIVLSKEDYEKAVVIRDEIKFLEEKNKK